MVRIGYRSVGTDQDPLLARIARARVRLSECLASPRVPPEVRPFLHEAPAMLEQVERSIAAGESVNPAAIEVLLEKIDSFLEDIGGLHGLLGADAGRRPGASLVPDPGSPPHRRLAERLYDFVQRRLDPTSFIALTREWAGEDAFRGNAFVGDRAVMAEHSAWLVYDKIPPGQDRRGVECFAESEGKSLPREEQAFLRLWLQDRPSVYRVESIRPGKGFSARDLLDDTVLRVRDWTNSRTLTSGAIVLARFAPFEGGTDYGLLGSLTAVPRKVWPRLKEFVDGLHEEYRGATPGAGAVAFFRAHHAQIRRRLSELARA